MYWPANSFAFAPLHDSPPDVHNPLSHDAIAYFGHGSPHSIASASATFPGWPQRGAVKPGDGTLRRIEDDADEDEIHDAAPSDWAAWCRMWSGYCAFYGVTMPEADVLGLWHRLLDANHPMSALVSTREGAPVGFAHYVLRPHTFSDRMLCYLEDLWVDSAVRGGGVGRELIETLVARGRERGWRRVYWHTETDNATARALYDRIARLTEYVRYDIVLP